MRPTTKNALFVPAYAGSAPAQDTPPPLQEPAFIRGILTDLHDHADRWKQPDEHVADFLADHLFHLRLRSRKKFGSFRLRPRPLQLQTTPDLVHFNGFKLRWESQLLGPRFHNKRDRQGLAYAFEEQPGAKTGAAVASCAQSHVHAVLLSPNRIEALNESLKKFALEHPLYDPVDIRLEPLTGTPVQLVRYVAKSYMNAMYRGHDHDLWERYPK